MILSSSTSTARRLVMFGVLAASMSIAQAQEISRVSLNYESHQANGANTLADVTADGTVVVFESGAGNMVPGDWNSMPDIYYRDLVSEETYRVTISLEGDDTDNTSHEPVISSDGSTVVFTSYATNLIEDDTNEAPDIYALDTGSGEIFRVSVGGPGAEANGASGNPAVSGDGAYITFLSLADNLSGADTNNAWDVYVRYRSINQTVRASVSSTGVQANGDSGPPSITDNGFMIVFSSLATNLVGGDTNDAADIFLRDLSSSTTKRISLGPSGEQANGDCSRPAISGDGRFVAFESAASNLVPGDTNGQIDVFVRDLEDGRTQRVSLASDGAQANSGSCCPQLSGDGRFIAFTSDADNLVGGDTNGVADIFVHDRVAETTFRVSPPPTAEEADGPSAHPVFSNDGGSLVFESSASNLVAGDDNDRSDIFLVRFAEGSPPSPAFTLNPSNPVVGETVQFSDQSGGSPTWWQWTFGDGASSPEQNPTHAYSEAGSYTVTLTTGNPSGASHLSIPVTVLPPGSAFRHRYLVAAAARASGAEGSFFVTDLDLKNNGDEVATYRVVWLRRGTPGEAPPASSDFQLAPGAAVRYHDAVTELFGFDQRSLGALRIESDSESLAIMSRTANVLADGSSFGQSIPGVTPAEMVHTDEVRQILFMTENAGFRSNLGLASGADTAITVHLRFVRPDGSVLREETVELAPWANLQFNQVFEDAAPVEAASVVFWSETPGAAYTVYGSVLDNGTSDPTTILPR